MQLRTNGWTVAVIGTLMAVALQPAEASLRKVSRTSGSSAAHSETVSSKTRGQASTVATTSGASLHLSFARGSRLPVQSVTFVSFGSKHSLPKGGKARYAVQSFGRSATYGYGGGLQCVPFARAASGIELKGNAAGWWNAAAGVYQRGHSPEPGSVLNFRPTGSMRLGHVAVVTDVIGSREITIDHANWWGPGASRGGVTRGVSVIDVSPANDWSEVRVSLGTPGAYGSTYPTYGFIYDRPDQGGPILEASARQSASEEVAEAPEGGVETHVARVVHHTRVGSKSRHGGWK